MTRDEQEFYELLLEDCVRCYDISTSIVDVSKALDNINEKKIRELEQKLEGTWRGYNLLGHEFEQATSAYMYTKGALEKAEREKTKNELQVLLIAAIGFGWLGFLVGGLV